MAEAATQYDDLTDVATVVRECLDARNGDVVEASDLMFTRAMTEPGLYQALMNPLVRSACYDAVRGFCRRNRRSLWNTKQPSADDEKGRIIALAGGTISSLLDFPLPGGLRLGDAGRDDVAAAAEFYNRQAQDMGLKARWLRLVAKKIPVNQIVSEVLDAEGLAKLREKAGEE